MTVERTIPTRNPSPPPAIRADDLAVTIAGRVALAGVSVAVPAGSTVAVIGANGSGKSTFLRAVAGLLPPSSGAISVPARARRGGVAFVLQTTEVDRSLPITVRETVLLARYARRGLFGRIRAGDRGAVDAALERMQVADLATRQLHELSGGQRQRVLVAQGLAQDADLLLLDEPFTGLDLVSRERILDAVAAEQAAGRTVVLSTHGLEDARRMDLVLLLAGRMVAFGPPDEVLTEETLRTAFGARVVQLHDGTVVVDDPHHAVGHP